MTIKGFSEKTNKNKGSVWENKRWRIRHGMWKLWNIFRQSILKLSEMQKGIGLE